ncbi:hypothetical protein BS50DRAFT_600867 [Corynespora cassiicola Philippines]|uniref:Uncharacterized protein n=1 Tax=Corynespora cassiicola Philippines TaxID=1448308 RepID=A0A2T2NQZ6_CORCC|nr:hypothetical protein BS50DRAFT_600867 [Corynespora cassiicola Philippines]
MHTKRAREDDSDSEDERYFKSPFAAAAAARTSPSSFSLRSSFPPSPPRIVTNFEAMTPAQSVHSEDDSPASVQHDPIMMSSPRNVDYDMEMDEEDDFDMRSQPPESPFMASSTTPNFLRPAKLNSDLFSRDSPVNNTGRMPTPIYPNFQGGVMNGLGYPSSGLAGGMSMNMNSTTVPSSLPTMMQPPPQARKQSMTAQPDHDRGRRMPSPISEDDDIPDTPTTLTQSQLSRLSVSHAAQAQTLDRMDADMAPPLAVPPTPTRGRKRSGALTGMGRFSIGYRDDCEKCRQRVPGHYSHFLP